MSAPRLRVPPAARESWDALRLALLATAVPCQGEPAAWYSEAPADRREAAAACSSCPLLEACGTYADAAGERFGTWAGRDRSPRPYTRTKEQP